MEHIAHTRERLDAFVAKISQISRAMAQDRVETGTVYVNGKLVTKSSVRISKGDVVTFTQECKQSLTPPSHDYRPVNLDLEILYEDDDVFLVNKPSMLICHHGASTLGSPTLLDGIFFLFNSRGIPFDPHYSLVHRLDKETTGCILVAKHKRAHTFLQAQFKARTVQKKYLAIVEGIFEVASARITAPIGRSVHNRTIMKVTKQTKHRDSTTLYTVRAENIQHNVSLVEFTLLTGRTHQIRVHSSAIHHPLYGDGKYGSQHGTVFYLHSQLLSWQNAENTVLTVTAPLPKTFIQLCSQLDLLVPEEYIQ